MKSTASLDNRVVHRTVWRTDVHRVFGGVPRVFAYATMKRMASRKSGTAACASTAAIRAVRPLLRAELDRLDECRRGTSTLAGWVCCALRGVRRATSVSPDRLMQRE